MAALAGVLSLSLLAALLIATRWPLVHDAALMDYIAFLIRSGFAPYRDIVDMNLPGAYLFPLAQTAIFGGSAAGLLAWVTIETAAAIASCISITGRGRFYTGLAAGCLISLIHFSQGAWNLGQRDWDIAVLLLVSCALLIGYLRSERYPLIACAFAAAGFATSIKPQAILLPIVALGYICAIKKGRTMKSIAVALIGLLPAAACSLLFLARYHAFSMFLVALHGLVPYYASLAHRSFGELAWALIGIEEKLLIAVCLAASTLYFKLRLWRSAEMNIVVMGFLFGIVSYFLQAKGWKYHRLPAWAFACVLLALIVEAALREKKTWMRGLGCALCFATAVMGPWLLFVQSSVRYPIETVTHLQRDLTDASAQSGEVQCLDMTAAGCVNVLYRLRLKPATGFVYDFYLFPERPTLLTNELQSRFLAEVTARPPRIIVLSSHIWPGDRFGYSELSSWPTFASFLGAHYQMDRQYVPPPKDSGIIAGYRIYRYCTGFPTPLSWGSSPK